MMPTPVLPVPNVSHPAGWGIGPLAGIAAAVAAYRRPGSDYACEHERQTRLEIARRLAALKGVAFAGEIAGAPTGVGAAPVYLVPNDTLSADDAAAFGIRDEHDLFGGVVPYPFVATKAITHPLVAAGARAPAGWNPAFAPRVADVVLRGYSAFDADDARLAGERLLALGPARIKPVCATAGRGQTVVADAGALGACLQRLPAPELARGVVLEENLTDVTTLSVGQVRAGGLVASYHGRQRLTVDNDGSEVYGGSALTVVRGGYEAVLALDLPDVVRQAVLAAHAYHAAVEACYPGFFASRQNYDVVHGRDAGGRWRCAVLEQSWRVGGASGAEIAALEAFAANPALARVQARCVEVYGAHAPPPPPHATVYFHGVDARAGALAKFTVVEPDDHA